ncbi:MAG: hypothetical protein LUB61_07890, partial [Eggerthellaceae bacterium]|nr:hypothetical protein [Eggerthellaceae bacterium]
MKITSTYNIRICDLNHIFAPTVAMYRAVVEYYIGVVEDHWDEFGRITDCKNACRLAEVLTIKTKTHLNPPYDFEDHFYKFPSYLRRAAIECAWGKVSAYHKLCDLYDAGKLDGKPGRPCPGKAFPVMFKDQQFKQGCDKYHALIKVY